MMLIRFILLCISAWFVSCGEPESHEVRAQTSLLLETPKPPSQAAPQSDFRAFFHPPEASKFRLGRILQRDRQFEFERIVGEHGVLAYGRHGSVLAVLNADAESSRAIFQGTAEDHHAQVLDYFTASGLPSDQLGEISIGTLMEGSGAAADMMKGSPGERRFLAYTTIIGRQLNGIPVRGSYALARMNARGEVDAEQVFWPAIPFARAAEAASLKVDLPSVLASIASRLPAEVRGRKASAVIYHSSASQETFETGVALEFEGAASDVLYSAQGVPIVFADEAARAATPRPRRQR